MAMEAGDVFTLSKLLCEKHDDDEEIQIPEWHDIDDDTNEEIHGDEQDRSFSDLPGVHSTRLTEIIVDSLDHRMEI